jgi:hypothetical protein
MLLGQNGLQIMNANDFEEFLKEMKQDCRSVQQDIVLDDRLQVAGQRNFQVRSEEKRHLV